MVDSVGGNSLSNLVLIAAFENETLRTTMLLCGAALIALGIILMFRHSQQWTTIQEEHSDKSRRVFEFRKWRRRTTIACLISISGCAMSAIYWAIDVRVVAVLSLILFASLVAVLGLAMLDLMSVSIRRYAEDDDQARQELVKEYHRLKEKANSQKAGEASEEGTNSA